MLNDSTCFQEVFIICGFTDLWSGIERLAGIVSSCSNNKPFVPDTLCLKTEDVNLDEGILTFHNGKNNVSRMIPMSDSLTKYLRKYDSFVDRSENEFFFPSLKGECYSPITIRNTFKKLMLQAEIPVLPTGRYPRIHDLRHTFAVHSLKHSIDKGLDPYCSLPALSTYMGHNHINGRQLK